MSKLFDLSVRAAATTVLACSLLSGAAYAGTDFGTDEEVRALVEKFVAYVKQHGTDRAAAALADKSTEFGAAGPGLMIWVDNKMGSHNKYPELAGLDFATMKDLRERSIISEFSAAADKGGDYSLNYWPHYVSQTEYEYHCFSTWVEKPRVMVSACR